MHHNVIYFTVVLLKLNKWWVLTRDLGLVHKGTKRTGEGNYSHSWMFEFWSLVQRTPKSIVMYYNERHKKGKEIMAIQIILSEEQMGICRVSQWPRKENSWAHFNWILQPIIDSKGLTYSETTTWYEHELWTLMVVGIHHIY